VLIFVLHESTCLLGFFIDGDEPLWAVSLYDTYFHPSLLTAVNTIVKELFKLAFDLVRNFVFLPIFLTYCWLAPMLGRIEVVINFAFAMTVFFHVFACSVNFVIRVFETIIFTHVDLGNVDFIISDFDWICAFDEFSWLLFQFVR
jgi:hypothetical protein